MTKVEKCAKRPKITIFLLIWGGVTHGADCARLRVTHDMSSKVRCAGPLVMCDCAPLTVYTVMYSYQVPSADGNG